MFFKFFYFFSFSLSWYAEPTSFFNTVEVASGISSKRSNERLYQA